MSGGTDLARLLATTDAVRRPGRFVFATVSRLPEGVTPLATVQEREGLSIVLEQADADRLGLAHDYVAGWITLQVHSALGAVGLTAAVSTALAAAGISCNVVAGNHHDHLLVPVDRTDEALAVLRRLAATAGQ